MSKTIDLKIQVSVRAKKSEIRGWHEDRIKVSLAAIPEDGLANKELVKLFSTILKIPKSQINLIQGSQSKFKTLRISGLELENLPSSCQRP